MPLSRRITPLLSGVLIIGLVGSVPAREETERAKERQAVTASLAAPVETGSLVPPVAIAPEAAPIVALATDDALASPVEGQLDLILLRRGIAAHRRGNVVEAGLVADRMNDPLARKALEWVALRQGRTQLGFDRLANFNASDPTFPMADWVRRRAEDALLVERRRASVVVAFFAGRLPDMASGRLALAIAERDNGDATRAEALALSAFQATNLPRAVETRLMAEFPGVISKADLARRAYRQVYSGNSADGIRLAGLAGEPHLVLARALAASLAGNKLPALHASIPAALRLSPHARFVQIQQLRRTDRLDEAANAMLAAPTAQADIVNGDEWWVERRLIARQLLDAGQPERAYAIVTGHAAQSDAMNVEAEFHAGWIALRFLGRPDRAAAHFAQAASIATTPISVARARYWQARAAEAMEAGPEDGGGGATSKAQTAQLYRAAAEHSATFYGQLARQALGESSLPVRGLGEPAEAFTATKHGKLIDMLMQADGRDFARPLLVALAQTLDQPASMHALAEYVEGFGQAELLLTIGKLAQQRGFPLDVHAFPTFGVPNYAAVEGSAENAMVYAIARQESAFNPQAVSPANARGLMQMLPATAAETARRFKLPFETRQLTEDPAHNARLGAAHLGDLLRDYRGSYVLAFAAYNAGGGRVREWIGRFGDPRKPGVDVIDWIERIPFTETRNYVQRVTENLQIYRARLNNNSSALLIGVDLQRGRASP